MKELIQPLLALAIIIPIIFATLLILKRFMNKSQRGNSQIKVLSQLSIGSKEKILHIEVCGTSLLVGVTPSNINMLHEFAAKNNENSLPTQFKPSLGNKVHA